MAKTDLKLYSTEAGTGKKITTSINYVNPEANSNALKTFAQKLNAFTTNTYGEADRVQTINVDTEQVPTEPMDIGEYSLTPISFSASALDGGHSVLVAQVKQTAVRENTYVKLAQKTGTLSRTTLSVSYDPSTGNIYLISTSDYTREAVTLTITAAYVNTNYAIKEASTDIRITA